MSRKFKLQHCDAAADSCTIVCFAFFFITIIIFFFLPKFCYQSNYKSIFKISQVIIISSLRYIQFVIIFTASSLATGSSEIFLLLFSSAHEARPCVESHFSPPVMTGETFFSTINKIIKDK